MIFITFEGPEGSGKSTQIGLLAAYLRKKGHKVVMTREPGGSCIADKIRQILLDKNNKELCPSAELLLYLSSRAQHLSDTIEPALKKGYVVLCDRFSDSTMAYQGYARGFDRKTISMLNEFASSGRKPDLTILLDIDIKKGLQRAHKAKNSKDRLELEPMAFHAKVRRGFKAIASKEPNRVKLVSITSDVAGVFSKVSSLVDTLFKEKNA